MSRLTGNDAKNLMEAYAAVYIPQEGLELTEEQVWEEVENWVNSLLEEGYDLSDYTWEEMYESYIEEVWGTKPNQYKPNKLDTAIGNIGRSIGNLGKAAPRPAGSRFAGPGVGWVGPAKPSGAPKPASSTPVAKPATKPATTTSKPAAAPKPAATTSRPTAAPKPAATTSRPTAAPKPAATTSLSSLSKQAAKAPAFREPKKTPNPLMQRTFGYQTGNAPDQQKARADKIIQSGAVKALAPAAKAPEAPKAPSLQQSIRNRRLNMEMEYDAYDLVLEYLLSEGHVDTVEEANYVMLEMDAEMIGDIVEQCLSEGSITDRPLGLMHTFARGVKTKKGKKTELMGVDKEGNPTGKYLRMKHEKEASRREKDSEEQRRKDRGAMSRGTWDKD